jgi:plasmid replication initiation protein
MYELLKEHFNYKQSNRYDKTSSEPGIWEISLVELRSLLWLSKDKYLDYRDFKKHLLIVCQKALKENTDIFFEFDQIRGAGKGGKISALRFHIYKNDDYKNKIEWPISSSC